MIQTGETEVLEETPVPVSVCPPQQKGILPPSLHDKTKYRQSSTYISLPHQQSAIFVKTICITEIFSLQELYKRYFMIREESEKKVSMGIKHKFFLFALK
jgi:hypothetical protein